MAHVPESNCNALPRPHSHMMLSVVSCLALSIMMMVCRVRGEHPQVNAGMSSSFRDLLQAPLADMPSLFRHNSKSSDVAAVHGLRGLERAGMPGHMSTDLPRLLYDHPTSRQKVFRLLKSAQAIANNGTFLGGNPLQFEDFNVVKLTRNKQDGELWSGALPLQDLDFS